jgi:hypothetical protein
MNKIANKSIIPFAFLTFRIPKNNRYFTEGEQYNKIAKKKS